MSEHPHYCLDEHRNVVPATLQEWAASYEGDANRKRIVADTHVGRIRIITAFLGVDEDWMTDAPPRVFGTKMFGGDNREIGSTTWAEAEACHAKTVEDAETMNKHG